MYKKHALAVLVAACATGQMAYANDYQAQLVPVAAERAIKDNYIVVFNTPSVLNVQQDGAVEAFAMTQAMGLENNYGIAVRSHFGSALNGVLVKATPGQLKQLLKDPAVKYVEQDQMMSVIPMVEAQADQSGATWGLDRVDQRDLPLNSNYHYDYDGSGVTAYVIDTGVLTSHNEFGGRASHGWDFVDNDSDATDCNGHGTHVAGTIGGNAYGVAKNVSVVGVRVLGCSGSGSNSGVINGINWVKNNASGPSVANMSLGGGASQATDDAVNSAVAAGITFVVAAGNDNSNACNYSPARAANAVTVGSTTSSDARSSFSNYGSCLDIYAPGSSIKSAWYTSNSATNTISGTSMASPHVAGVVALYLDETPSLSPTQVVSRLTSRASDGKVSDAKSGSPNKLLYSLASDDGGCGSNCPPTGGELSNGQSVSVSGAQGSENRYYIDVPAGQSALKIALAGGSGDGDIYVSYGSEPTTTSYQCRPYLNGNNESCDFTNPQAGRWHVMVRGYTSYSGASLTGTYSSGGGGGGNCSGSDCLQSGVPVTGLSGSSGSTQYYKLYASAGSSLSVSISGGTGDADLYVKAGSQPTTTSYDCRPYKNGNSETCNFSVNQSGYYYVMLRGYTSYSGVTLQANY